MKLLLASDGEFLIKTGYGLLGIPKEQMKIGYITTAANGATSRGYLDHYVKEFRANGYAFEPYDIEGKSETKIREFLKDKNVIHVEGGNTFYLLKEIRKTGFEKIIKEALDRGIIYVGVSAGAYVAGPTIETSTWKREEDMKERFGVTDFTAMNLVPFLIKAHYTDDKKEVVKKGMSKSKYPARILRDGQGLLVKDGRVTFVGEGKEVKL